MDIQTELAISENQPLSFAKALELRPLFDAFIEHWELDSSDMRFAACVFYDLGRIHGIRQERARRKKRHEGGKRA